MKRPSRRTLASIAAALLVVALAVTAVLWAKGVASAATSGKNHAVAGARSLAAGDATAAVVAFRAASADFRSAERSLGPTWAVDAVAAIPWVGRQYATTRALTQIGGDASEAGATLSDVLRGPSASSVATGTSGGIVSRLAARHVEVEAAVTSLISVVDRADALDVDGLMLPQLADAIRSLRAALRTAAPMIERARTALPLMSYLLSSQHRILVVSQNGAELRPTGGFAGTFGIIDIGPTGVHLDKYKDVYVLPNPPGRVTPPPGARMTKDFGFRDANWWIDFPTSARAMLGFWAAYKQPPVDGIIAIDTVMMKELLKVTGPVDVASIGETFTADNLLDRLLYLVEVKPGTGKEVLVALAGELEKRVLSADALTTAKSAQAIATSADARHVQMFFTDPRAEAAVESIGWSGRVSAGGATDLIAVSNAMTRPGKVNVAMRKTIAYDVALRPDRSASTTLTLTYANTGPYPLPMPSIFRNWLRVYRAPGSTFAATTPRGATVATTTESGLPAEVRQFTLLRGQSRTEILTARLTSAIATGGQGASGTDFHYRLRLIRQADLQEVPTTVMVTAPPGWTIIDATARFTASGTPVDLTRTGGVVRLSVPLRGDLELEVRLRSPETP